MLNDPPWWIVPFAAYASERMAIGRVSVLVTRLGRLLTDDESPHPQALLERARTPGRSAGPLARTLEDFFIEHQLAFGLDQPARLAAGRRQRRVDATPEPLRTGVELFCERLVGSRERAIRAGIHPRTDSTIEGNLANVRDFARFLVDERSKTDWSTVQPADIDAFLNTQPTNRRRRLTSLRQFFAWARKNRIVLVDPTTDLALSPQRGFKGETLTIGEQRRLFRRWTTDAATVHPHEALVGLLALLHALSLTELHQLLVSDIDHHHRTIRVAQRPHPLSLDPVSFATIERCLQHHDSLRTQNPHLIVTKVTRPRLTPPSPAYMTHVLDDAGVRIKKLRATRLVELLHSLDVKLVAEALAMNGDGLLDYVEAERVGGHS